MAELDEFLKPQVEKDVMPFFENPMETVWKIPTTHYIPPYGETKADFTVTTRKDVAEKAQKILDAGFTFTFEVLRMVNMGSTCIEGKIAYEEGEAGEESDVAQVLTHPGKGHFEKVDQMILDFVIPEDGTNIVRRY